MDQKKLVIKKKKNKNFYICSEPSNSTEKHRHLCDSYIFRAIIKNLNSYRFTIQKNESQVREVAWTH